MEIMFWIWLGIIVVGVAVEVATLKLISIWFSFGAIIPIILSVFKNIPIFIQAIVFVLASLTFILTLRNPTQKFLFKTSVNNLETYIGQKQQLTSDFLKKNGTIQIDGVRYKVTSDEDLTKGNIVEIVAVKNNKFIVKNIKTSQNIDKNDYIEESGDDEFIIEKTCKPDNPEQN